VLALLAGERDLGPDIGGSHGKRAFLPERTEPVKPSNRQQDKALLQGTRPAARIGYGKRAIRGLRGPSPAGTGPAVRTGYGAQATGGPSPAGTRPTVRTGYGEQATGGLRGVVPPGQHCGPRRRRRRRRARKAVP